jgi:hypothetical protein
MATQGVVERAVRKEIRDLAAATVAPGLAAMAINLAKHQDAADAPAAAAVAARDLRRILQDLRRLAPGVAVPGDVVDEITQQRELRRGGIERNHGRQVRP